MLPLREGEEHTLGRFDMDEQSLYVSRRQCLVQVENGVASLISVGKPPTLWRANAYSPWMILRKGRPLGDDIGFDGAHVLADGEQISLDIRNPEGAIFTVTCEEEGADTGYPLQQGGYGEFQQQQSGY